MHNYYDMQQVTVAIIAKSSLFCIGWIDSTDRAICSLPGGDEGEQLIFRAMPKTVLII